jgi:hypothetical protein
VNSCKRELTYPQIGDCGQRRLFLLRRKSWSTRLLAKCLISKLAIAQTAECCQRQAVSPIHDEAAIRCNFPQSYPQILAVSMKAI